MLDRDKFFVIRGVLLLFCCISARAQQLAGLRGTVRDGSGAVIPGAEVRLMHRSAQWHAASSSSGEFVFEWIPQGEFTLQVEAVGFSRYSQEIKIQGTEQIDVTLFPAKLTQQVVVIATGTATPISETAESVTLLSRENLAAIAALSEDDALRQAPGFTLFRRSGSRTANPTSQGVSLRGIGASGASRALVFEDGVPLNDAFGGWVYWNRLPRVSVASIEVLRGGVSNLYGSGALGGVINIATRKVDQTTFAIESSMGNELTPNGSVFASYDFKGLITSLSAEGLHTDGYLPVAPEVRGQVDTKVASEYGTGEVKLRRNFRDKAEFAASFSSYKESRNNGSPLQINDTSLDQIGLAGWLRTPAGEFRMNGYGGGQSYHQRFSAIALDRNSETLARTQSVPSQQLGARLEWVKSFPTIHSFIGGIDTRQVRGASDEIVYSAGRPATRVLAGGRQLITGFFLHDSLHLPGRWIISLGGRGDIWQNYQALNFTLPLSAGPTPTSFLRFPDRSQSAFSPRLSLLRTVSDHLSISASGYRSFRAPTLNELYRTFRVGNINTLANQNLAAERLAGIELGSNLTFSKVQLHTNVFRMDVTHPILNATLATTPTLITRQRQNIGRTASTGLDLESEWHLTAHLRLDAGYQFVHAVVLRFPGNRALEGLDIPQVARHQFTGRLDFSHSSWRVGMQGRGSSKQFEDDQNLLPLGSYGTVDVLVSKQLRRDLAVFVAAENLLNQRYAIGRTPVATLAQPLFVRMGLRFTRPQ